jgi:MFS transporter, PAT family, beta-lactamase induction signal transducer AmpG
VAGRPSLTARVAILSIFYLVQGLPFGFQATALPVYLTASGASLTMIGLVGGLAAPWLLKPVWAPIVDRYQSARFGRRRGWIIPLQAALASTCLAAAFVPTEQLGLLLTLIALTNLFAATMDIAVDGLAIDLLAVEELGWGNIAQVVGFKVGMLIGGGILVWASQWIGWQGLFLAIAGLISLALVITLAWREPPLPAGPSEAEAPVHTSFRALFRALARALAHPGGVALLVVVVSYKAGESIADAMFEPFLIRHAGWEPAEVGLVIGTWGMGFSLAGSFLGGWLASRVGVYRALLTCALARTGSIAAVVWLGTLAPDAVGVSEVVFAKGLEELAGGGLTTAMFAFMMARVDRRIGATHYTLLAGVEVFGKTPGGLLSGVLADAIGFAGTFAVGLGLSLVFLPLLALVRPRPSEPT